MDHYELPEDFYRNYDFYTNPVITREVDVQELTLEKLEESLNHDPLDDIAKILNEED